MIKTLRLRLTLWHAGLYAALACVVFLIAYTMVSQLLLHEIDADLEDTAQEFAERLKSGGITVLKVEVDSETASHGTAVFFARYLNLQRQVKLEQISSSWQFSIPKPNASVKVQQWHVAGSGKNFGPVRVLALKIAKYGWIEVGLSLMDYEAQMHKIRIVFALALLVMVVLGVFVGWLQLRSVFQSVEKVRSTAIGISKGDMNRRVQLANNGQELSDLAESFNSMLDRIQVLLKEMRDVSDHIAHDLRTPVSRIRGVAETALMAGEKMPNMQMEAFSTIVDEANQLGEMINTMLEISQTDAGLIQQQHEVVNLSIILHEGHELFLPVAEDIGVTLSILSPIQPMKVKGSKIHLQRAIANLIDNAIKFSPEGSHISLSSEQNSEHFIIHICDDGIGISPEDKTHIFDRFYRSDQSRSKPGNGLGLSYSMSIIRNHGGTISVMSAIGEGSTFTVTLPRA